MKKPIIIFIVFLCVLLNANMLSAVPDTWTKLADFGSTERVDAVGFSILSKGYIGTGFNGTANTKDFWEYDSTSNTWTQKADFGGTARQAAVGFSIGSKGYVGTGHDGANTKDFWEYDPAGNTWTQKPDFGGTARYNAVGFSIGNKGYIGTGYDGTYTKDFWEYDPAANTWTQKANLESIMGGTRNAAVGFSIGSKGYLGTGVRRGLFSTTILQDFYEYDPATNIWTMKANLPTGARWDAIGFSIGSKGYIGLGLIVTSSTVYYKDFWEYDPAGDTWTQKADFGDTIDPAEAGRYACVGFSIGSKGYVSTGYDGSTFFKDFWEYDSGIDTIPDPFTFTDQTDVALSTVTTSDTITVAGIASAAFISVTGGEYSIDGSAYRSDESTVSNGANVTVRQTSSANYSTKTDTTLYIGGVSDTFSVTTLAATADLTPDPFSFTDQTDVDLNTTITSDAIAVSGITSATPITITGGTYSINGGEYTSDNGTVENGDTVTIRLNSSENYLTTTYATLIIGGVSDTFSVTTPLSPFSGSSCFIATAAFGSPLAGQVDVLRQFRDRYLLTNAPGQKFVAWYYRNGPDAANFIKDKPLVKLAVRAALYPLIAFSMLIISGYLPFVSFGILLSSFLYLRFKPKKIHDT